MRNSQGTTLLILGLSVVLFFFSLALLPPVELYCRFVRPAIVLLAVQSVLIIFRLFISREAPNRALVIATFVFSVLGIFFNAVLLVAVRGKC